MNTQVQKLANIWANRRSEDPDLGIVYTFSEKALQAFAEAMTKEAGNALLEWKKEPFPFDESTAVWILKQHFGVEE